MIRIARSHLSRHLVAYLALFVALGGTSYAAAQLPKNSVGPGQIKKNGVGSSEIKKNAVNSAKIKNKSLKAEDFAAGVQLKGDKGDKGDPGAPGTAGAPGKDGVNGAATVTYRRSLAGSANVDTFGETTAACNPGERLIGGGGGWVNNTGTDYIVGGTLSNSGPGTGSDTAIPDAATPANWHVAGKNTSGGAARIMAYAVCATP